MAKPKHEAVNADAARGVIAGDGTLKARIERAALTLFAERGVDGITTKQIAAAAGASEGAIYRHYPSKDALAEALFFTIHDRLTGLVRAAAREGDDISEKAGAIVKAYCKTADDDWPLFSYHALSLHRFLRKGDKKTDDPVKATEDIVKGAMKSGEIPKGDAALLAAMALGVVLQPAAHKAYGLIEGPLSAHTDDFTRAVTAILRRKKKS
ncbi:MAG: TetR/AcrR family transcriptional regulator [Pseudomonadota bacterium]